MCPSHHLRSPQAQRRPAWDLGNSRQMHSQSVPQVDFTRSASPTGVFFPPPAHGHGAQQPPSSSNSAPNHNPIVLIFLRMMNPRSPAGHAPT